MQIDEIKKIIKESSDAIAVCAQCLCLTSNDLISKPVSRNEILNVWRKLSEVSTNLKKAAEDETKTSVTGVSGN